VCRAGWATLTEVEEHWCWADLMDARLVIELERRTARRARQIESARAAARGRG
jgi:hypothetical protein